MRFRDRRDAGRRLAGRIVELELTDPVVLALPRGGVPVAFEIAVALGAPLDVFVARKVGAPRQPELAIGAVAENGGTAVNNDVLAALGLTDPDWRALVARDQVELVGRVQRYRGGRPLPLLVGRDVVLADDGLATGATAEAAVAGLRTHNPARLVLAAPVCARSTADRLAPLVDDLVCGAIPDRFHAVGQWYERFDQTTDEEVLDLLARAGRPPTG